MDNDLKEAFKKVKYHPECRLSDDIWHSIENYQNKKRQIKFWIYSGIGIISLVGFIPSLLSLLEQFSNSGFYNYFSLIFSNNSSISLYWKELLLSIAGSLPVLSLMVSIFLLLILFLSIKQTIRQIVLPNKLLIA